MAPPRKEDIEATLLRRCIYLVFGLAGILAVYSQAGLSSTKSSHVIPLAVRSPHGHSGHGHSQHDGHVTHNTDTAGSESNALAAGVDVLASLGEGLSVALRGAVLGARIPTKVVRRSFRDEETGALVEEESAYFSVPEGEGNALADSLRAEQVDLVNSGHAASAVDEIVLRLARATTTQQEHESHGGDGSEEEEVKDEEKEVETPSTAILAPAIIESRPVSAWKQLDIPTRPSEWVKPQYFLPGERESVPSSRVLQEATAHSLKPPRALSELPPADALELSNRLVIAIAMGVHSGKLIVANPGQRDLLLPTPPLRVLLPTFLPTAQTHHEYRFYFAYDHNDPVYEKEENRAVIEAVYAEAVKIEDAQRWHPTDAVSGVIDGSRLVVSIHWVHCEYSGKPGWAHSDAVIAAVKEGADYVYRTNDDTEFPHTLDWVDRMVADLRRRSPSNLGVTGPTCNEGATW